MRHTRSAGSLRRPSGVARLLTAVVAVTAAVAVSVPGATAAAAAPPSQTASPTEPTPPTNPAPTGSPTTSSASPTTPATPVAAATDSASAQATATGKPVEVSALTTETVRVMANPDGTFTATSNSRPVRVKKNGAWTTIDTTLAKNADGTFSPKASLLAMAFSAGGTGPAITVTDPSGAHSLALSWPTALPAPTVSGNTALYADVLPGVDLRLAARGDSYSEILIVHDAQAAADPALASLTMRVHGEGVTLKAGKKGELSGTDAAGSEILSAPQSVMWDSHPDPHAGPTPTADDPGSGLVTPLATTVTPKAGAATETAGDSDANLTLSAPASALTGKGLVYPLFMDPGVQYGQNYWDEVDDQGDAWWNDSTQNAKVGYCDFSTCVSPWRTMRAYFQMNTTYLSMGNGTHATVYSANFSITQIWNGANGCTAEPVDLYTAGIINSGTAWPGPLGSLLDTQSSGAGNGCNAASVSFNAKPLAQSAANNWWTNATFGLKAHTESDDLEWKQFNNQATLSINYDYPPNVPGNLRVSDQLNCSGTIYTPDAQPSMYATATDNNPQPQNLNYWFEMWPAGGTSHSSWNTTAVTRASGQEAGWQENLSTNLGISYQQFQVRADNGPISSDWTPPHTGWFYFHTLHEDLSAVHPTVSSYDYPHDSAGNALWGAPQGYGQFALGNGGNANVAGFQYSYDNNAFPAPPTCGNGLQGSSSGAVKATGSGVGTGGALLPVPAGTALAFGHHILYVRGYDMVGNPTGVTAYQFMVSQNGPSATAHLPLTSTISNALLGKCLDDPNNGGKVGDIAQVWDCNNNLAQEWSLITGANGTDTVQHGGLCLDIISPSGNGTATANGTKVQLYTCNGWLNQQWQIFQDGNGNWGLKNPNSGRCLDDPVGNLNNGTQLQIYDCNSSPAQKWSFDLDPYRYGGADAFAAGGVTATGTHANASLTTQGQICDANGNGCLSGGQQLWWFGAGAGSQVSMPFNVGSEADYALSARLTNSSDYGQYEFAVDGTALNPQGPNITQAVDSQGRTYGRYDAFRSAGCCALTNIALGGLHLTKGAHTLTITIVGTSSTTSGPAGPYGLGVDYFAAAMYGNQTAASFAASLNNHGISDDANPAGANLDLASPSNSTDVGGTGVGDSLSKQALAAAHLAPATAFALDGIGFTMPRANAAGNDNTIAMGQTITLDPSQQIRANAVGLLVVATGGGTPQSTATINYDNGQSPDIPAVSAVADWCSGPPGSAAYNLAYRNTPSGKDTSSGCLSPKVYLVVLPAHPMTNVVSVTLPYLGTGLTPGSHNPALHVLAIGVRPAGAADLTTSADASGGGHGLTMTGNVGFDGYAYGKQGAAEFDGSGGYAATSGPVLDTTKAFSVSAWVNAQQLSGWETMVVQQATTASGFYLQFNGTTWEFTRVNADGTNPAGEAAVSNTPATTGWHHLVGTWDSNTGKMTLYVDGTAQSSAPTDTTPIASTGPLVIGQGFSNGQANNPFDGEITDVQVYQRALTQTDVTTLYNGAVTNDLTASSGAATGWWQLQDFGRNWTGVWGRSPTARRHPAPRRWPV